jgi:hypothetical protein
MFAAFGEQRLDHIDGTTSAMKIAEWKSSEKTKEAYSELFSNHGLLTKSVTGFLSNTKKKNCPQFIVRMF